MKFNHLEDFSLLLVLFLLCNFVQSETASACISKRRILHEPLFPGPPLVVIRSPPPPASSDHPFFNENPSGSSSNRNPPPSQPPPPIPHSEPRVPNKTMPLSVQVNHPTKKLAIAASVGIVTLGMLSALAFFLYRHRASHTDEPRKIVRGNSRRDLEESRMPPPPLSDFLYMGTVEPAVSRRSVMEGENGLNESPYHRLKSIKRADRYRPSPDLQPLPPLTRQIHRISSSSAMFSSDDESLDMFYTPQRNADGTFAPVPCQNYPTNDNSPAACSASHLKRASPKSRVAVSSPDIKCTFIPPIKKPPQPPLPPPVPPPRPLHVSTPRPPVKEQDTKIATSSLSPLDADDMEGGRPRLKPLHWDKVRAASDRATVWDQLNSSNFQLNEDMMETLFGCNSANSDPKARKKMAIPHAGYEVRVLDPKKSQNIAILLRGLHMTMDEVSEALLDGNTGHLGVEVLETLVKMAPTKEEEIKLQEYKGSVSLLGSAERFLKNILEIPFAFERVEAMLYKATFETEVYYLRKSYKTLEAASEELKNSRLFIKLLEAVLKAGNRMNVGTNRGDARAFKLDTLLKLVDVKATDGKTTLLHFVVQELTRSEGAVSETENKNIQNTSHTAGFKKQNLEVVAGLSRDLGNVKMVAGMDSDVLHSYVSKLETGIAKIRSVLKYEKPGMQGKFFESMHSFIKVADKEILLIKDDEMKALSLVKEATEYFHGDNAKEEAHPLRIFMIVRDFLSILDHVCKEVGRIQDRVLVGSARSCQISTNASPPAFNR